MLSSFHWDPCISGCHSNSPSSCGLDDCKRTCGVTSCSLPLYLLQPLHFLPVGPRQPVVVLAVFFMTASITLTGEFVCLLLWLWRSLLYLLSIHSTNHPPHFLLQLAFPEYIGYCKQNERESGLLYVVCTYLLFAASRRLVCNLGSLHLICSASLALFFFDYFYSANLLKYFYSFKKKKKKLKLIEWLFEKLQLKRMNH